MSAFGAVIDRLPMIAFESEMPLNLIAISDYWTALTGQPHEQALGHGWMVQLDPNSVSSAFTQMEASLNRGEEVQYVVRCKTRSSDWVWLRMTVRPRLEGGRAVGFSGVGVVVPPPEQLDQQGRVRLDEVERAQLTADALLAGSNDLLFHVNSAGQFLAWRAGSGAALYKPPERFLGFNFEEVLPERVARMSRAALERAHQTREAQTITYEMQTMHSAPAAQHYEARVVPLKDGDAVIHVRDVTVIRRNEAELVAAREEAIERSRLKTQFLANVSHEIRTPLTGILGVTELLKQSQLPEELRDYIDVLQNAGESLLAIVNDVLDLSKIEANRVELEPRVFDLEHLVVETVRMFSTQAQKKGLELMTDVSVTAKGPVRGDAARIRQILINLMGNALKFTEQGSVRVTLTRAGDRIRLLVKDSGPGIASEHHARIFEAFEQGDVGTQRRYGGTGLGLAITRRIARLMGGEVTLRSAPGEGSEFELEVPVPSVVIALHAPSTSRVTPPPRALRVLLAEDDAVNASMTAALLNKLGHQVHVVGNGRECVTALEKGEHDLILMDVHMPELDGLEATKLIRQSERGSTKHLPIVALTANAMKGDDLRCLNAGMDAYLPKPVTVAALKDLLIWFGSQE
ncbi:MAG: ATP-binding protein [Archangium sp.]